MLKSIATLLLLSSLTIANAVTISANSTNILTEYKKEESCQKTLASLGIKNTCSEVKKVINAFNKDPIMVAVILQESYFNPNAINHNKNGTVDRGILQINSAYYKPDGNLDHTLAYAKTLKITNWCAYTSGAYKKHLLIAKRLINLN